jgi:hypothetical protein
LPENVPLHYKYTGGRFEPGSTSYTIMNQQGQLIIERRD